ncbi:MAG: pyrroline-5-carboxylate reductase [SAR202 cluster bacterium]|nr:pyrroline-5-carboxylate reductase [SAR202 cluster bacterium]|tara:strand:+ start:36776 stop:37609 length:834 start_codon:yes stop_codon:yes gene_type:complete
MKADVKISFIGGGNMAEAIISSIIANGLIDPKNVLVSEPVSMRREHLSAAYNISSYSDTKALLLDINESKEPNVIVIAVKPQQLYQVTRELNSIVSEDHAILSIVAGVSIDTLTQSLGHNAIIRVMPNTPAQIGKGMSVWAVSESISDLYVDIAREIFQALGLEILVDDEKYIDMATALSASGPAYVFMFLEAMIDAGVYIGLSRDISSKLAIQTVLGSIELVAQTDKQPSDLRAMVTSPGGTTAEAILVLEEEGFRSAILNAVIAAYNKAVLLGKQ